MNPIETDINALPGLDWRVRRVLEKIVENQNAIIKRMNAKPKFTKVAVQPRSNGKPMAKKKKQ